MNAPPPAPREHGPTAALPVELEVVLPVYNEQHVLEASVRRLHDHLALETSLRFRITIADNASTDATLAVASVLAAALRDVRVLHLDRKGRGRALRTAWNASGALVVAYMDIDLSTDLKALCPLVAPLLRGESDVAIGSRLATGAQVSRGPKREVISRAYNRLLQVSLGVRFSDAQCGFKAVRRDAIEQLLPIVEDESWFFDTELLYQAERHGMRISEIPVHWREDPDSRVDIPATVVEDLRGIARLRRSRRRSAPDRGRERVAGHLSAA